MTEWAPSRSGAPYETPARLACLWSYANLAAAGRSSRSGTSYETPARLHACGAHANLAAAGRSSGRAHLTKHLPA
ncbi:hypothetical protein A0H81_00418 [Grifola frondosa]|uniref:Uncharacterized protein n=1 Tax=Grifola frondosa TaxID=5627 RepID=A0A1C7MR23_GRIFR|nr:hypothetical protein A0H81_00418 [Grifola frondosa]